MKTNDKDNPQINNHKISSNKSTSVLEDEMWSNISQDWQAQTYKSVDIPKLIKQTKRRVIQAKILMILNIVLTLGLVIVTIYCVIKDLWDKPTLIYAATLSVSSIIFVVYEIKIRLNSWRLFEVEPDLIIQTAIRGCEASLQYIKLTKISFYFLLPVMNWYVFEVVTLKGKPLLYPILVANAFLLFSYLIVHFYQRKRKAELQQLTNSQIE